MNRPCNEINKINPPMHDKNIMIDFTLSFSLVFFKVLRILHLVNISEKVHRQIPETYLSSSDRTERQRQNIEDKTEPVRDRTLKTTLCVRDRTLKTKLRHQRQN